MRGVKVLGISTGALKRGRAGGSPRRFSLKVRPGWDMTARRFRKERAGSRDMSARMIIPLGGGHTKTVLDCRGVNFVRRERIGVHNG